MHKKWSQQKKSNFEMTNDFILLKPVVCLTLLTIETCAMYIGNISISAAPSTDYDFVCLPQK